MLEYLRKGSVVRGEFLADLFHVGIRTVYRDIHNLRRAGHPIKSSAGVGFQFRNTRKFSQTLTSAQELSNRA